MCGPMPQLLRAYKPQCTCDLLTPPNQGDLEYTFLPSSAPHQVEEPAVCSYVLRATHPLACD